eukprot:89285-Chlamydomonas_euryale.AAC.2
MPSPTTAPVHREVHEGPTHSTKQLIAARPQQPKQHIKHALLAAAAVTASPFAPVIAATSLRRPLQKAAHRG